MVSVCAWNNIHLSRADFGLTQAELALRVLPTRSNRASAMQPAQVCKEPPDLISDVTHKLLCWFLHSSKRVLLQLVRPIQRQMAHNTPRRRQRACVKPAHMEQQEVNKQSYAFGCSSPRRSRIDNCLPLWISNNLLLAFSGPCTLCAVNTYNSKLNQLSCSACPAHSSSVQGSAALSACLCLPGELNPAALACTVADVQIWCMLSFGH